MISILILAFTFSSCKVKQNINDTAIVQAIGIDRENGNYKISLQILDINKGIGTNEGVKGNITSVITGKGKDISSAIKSIEETLSEALFFGHNKLIVIGGTSDSENKAVFKFLADSTVVRPDVYVLKSIQKSEIIIKNKQRGSRVPAENICRQMRKEKCVFTVNDYLNKLKKNDIPVIEAVGDYTLFRSRQN